MKPLYGYNNQESAYLVSDYPYGAKRCRIRYWLESDEKKGFRFCSQTEHPTKLIWNNPKKSTYALLAGCMFLDEKEYVQWDGLNEYSKAQEVLDYITNFPQANLDKLKVWCRQKIKYTEGRISGKFKWTINNVVQSDSETKIEEYKNELVIWQQCVDKLGPSLL